MNEKLNLAYELFFKQEYQSAKNLFIELDESYGAGLCAFLLKDLKSAEFFFQRKLGNCPASGFGLTIVNLIQDLPYFDVTYFQVRSFLEIYLNLLIENNMLDWAQKIIDNYEFFTKANFETPKFIARVLSANDFIEVIHPFAKLAYDICFYDAEIHYIEAITYLKEDNIEGAKNCIKNCLSFAPEYYPILKLQASIS